jgi:VanZ family protein
MIGRGRAVLLAALALSWAGALFWLSSQPNPLPFVPRGFFTNDKLLHAGAYALLAALVRGALAGTRLAPAAALLLAVVAGTAYGATDEWHQMHVPNRSPEASDLAADAVGAALGAACAAFVLRRQRTRASIAT